MHNLNGVKPKRSVGASAASGAGGASAAFTVAAGHRVPHETVFEHAYSGRTVCIRKYELGNTDARGAAKQMSQHCCGCKQLALIMC